MNCRNFRNRCDDALDAGRPIPPAAELHARRCPACGAYLAARRRLIEQLRAEAAALSVNPPPYLSQRVMAEIEASDSPAAPSRGWPVAWPGAIALAAVVLLAGWLFIGFSRRGSDHPRVARHSACPPLAIAAVRASRDVQSTVQDPFASEVKSLASDVESAIGFLLDCLPSYPDKPDKAG